MNEDGRKFNWFTFLIFFCVFAVIVTSFYFFYFKKDYNFIVEVSCNQQQDVCLVRDCSNAEDCPPNGYQVFKRYSISANDFKTCENGDCAVACEESLTKCELLECIEDLDYGETCSDPKDYMIYFEPENIEIENQPEAE